MFYKLKFICDIIKKSNPLADSISKKSFSTISLIPSVLIISLFVGGLLSLIIGFRNDEFVLISPTITILDSISLGSAVVISLYFTRYLSPRKVNQFLILLLSFCVMLGEGIITTIIIFILSPSSFFYSDNRTITFLLINSLFFITINIIINGHIMFLDVVRGSEKALNEEKNLKSQMELKLLSSKINPHFLFNSLNLVLSLLKKPEKAETALINLSELLRYQLDFSEETIVSLKTELEAVDKYLSIQQMRFGEKMTFQIDAQTDGNIPPLIIQPLVENCVKHNIDFTDHLHIDLKVNYYNKVMRIIVIDSQAKLTPDMLEKGIGLSVTKKRVELLGGEFNIKNGGIEISFKS